MHVLVFRAGARKPGAPVCRKPVFGKRRGSTDNSLIAFGRSIVVENNYGYTGPAQVPPATDPFRNTPTTEPGVTRVVVDYKRGGCRKAWTNRSVRVPSSVSKASTATGLVYVYEHPAADEVRYVGGEPATGPEDPWYLTALDARTGQAGLVGLHRRRARLQQQLRADHPRPGRHGVRRGAGRPDRGQATGLSPPR